VTNWIEIAHEDDFEASAFEFADGSILDLNLHYRMLGTLSARHYGEQQAIPATEHGGVSLR
jgi:hypothetical protein